VKAYQNHPIDGEQLTVAQIKKRWPALSDGMIRGGIARGITTSAGLINYRRPKQYRPVHNSHLFNKVLKG
jgi:hypothetical protein